MRKVATVNGVPVYSDKDGSISVYNSRVMFMDGSSCDVSTRSINNRGSGSIRIGDSVSSAPRACVPSAGSVYRDAASREDHGQDTHNARGPIHFDAISLRLSNLVANIVVEVWDRSGMEVFMSGPQSSIEAIVANAQGPTLSIYGKGPKGSSGVSIRVGHGGSSVSVHGSVVGGVVVTGGNVTVIGDANDSSADAVTVTVKVPRGAGIALDDTHGEATIGDVDGDLDVSVKGSSHVSSGRMRRATLSLAGSGSVTISEINGPLMANIMGSGKIKVNAGSVTGLSVQTMGSGDFRFDGVADTATLSVMGSGGIRVARCKTKPTVQRMGSGKITVG